MRNLHSVLSREANKAKRIRAYYENFFSDFKETDLFEVYDVEKEEFIKFTGREGSHVINRETLIKNLSNLELYNESNVQYIVLPYSKKGNIDFRSPVFIGSSDGYRSGVG